MITKHISITDYIRDTDWHFKKIPPIFVPQQIIKARKSLQEKLGNIDPKSPAPYELQETWDRTWFLWNTERSIDKLERKHLKRISYILFYPKEQQQWFGANAIFLTEYFSWLTKQNRAKHIASLIKEFLKHYPTHLSTYLFLQSFLSNSINSFTGRLEVWCQRCKKYFLLEDDGSKYFASLYLQNNDQKTGNFLEEAGLVQELAVSNFLKSAQSKAIQIIEETLTSKNCSIAMLERLFDLVVKEDGSLRFRAEYRSLAEALLTPFVNIEPPQQVQELIQKFLLRHIGDPRISPSEWQGIDNFAKVVMLRWLTEVALEDFFKLLDHTALDAHWRYRKAFWDAYLKKRYITDAWVILGPNAGRIAKGFLKDDAKKYGTLSGGNIERNHSVLLLRIGNVIISEWSHNGKCRAWVADNLHAPKFYDHTYTRYDLIESAQHEQTHYAPEYYTWQRKLSSFIESRTGIKIREGEYRLR
jgi:hypothetical protein